MNAITFSRSACEEPNFNIPAIGRSTATDFLLMAVTPGLQLLYRIMQKWRKNRTRGRLFFGCGSETMVLSYAHLVRLHVVPFNEVQLPQRLPWTANQT